MATVRRNTTVQTTSDEIWGQPDQGSQYLDKLAHPSSWR